MLIKKLAVPLINDKILLQAEHCTIATAAISSQGFDLIASRLSTKCKVEIVTGLDSLTSPAVLKRIWMHLPDRVSLKVYSKNIFHSNVYIFDLPFRKAVAFIGSGSLTLEGLKDHEEIFYKITDPKEIESLKSWFIGYYEYAEPLTETIIQEYEWIYPSMKQREIFSRQEKDQFTELTTRGFNWDNFKFKNQYFKKEDYLTFSNSKASITTVEIETERSNVKNKLLQLHESLKRDISLLKISAEPEISSLIPADHQDHKLRSMWIAYGKSGMKLQLTIRPKEFGIWLIPGKQNEGKEERENFYKQMNEPEYRTTFFKLLTGLGSAYCIEIAGEKKNIDSFQNEDTLWEFTKSDDWKYYNFLIGKNYSPGDPEISNDKIASTMATELGKLILLYRHFHN